MRPLDNNLAAKRFLNRRTPLLVMACLGGLAVAATATNLGLFIVRGREYRTLAAEETSQRARVKEMESALKGDRERLEGREAARYAEEATFVEGLLARKRFSWTLFLTRLEAVKPFGLLFSEISPRLSEEGGVEIRLSGSANQREELLKLEQNLLSDLYFADPKLSDEKPARAGGPLLDFRLTVRYLPEGRGTR